MFAVVGFLGLKLEFAALDKLGAANAVDPFSEVLINNKNAESKKNDTDDIKGAAHSYGEVNGEKKKEEANAENDDSTGIYIFTGVGVFFFESFFHDNIPRL